MSAARAISVSRHNGLCSWCGTEAVFQWMTLLTCISINCTSISCPLLWLNLWFPILDTTRVQHENSAKNDVLVRLAAGSTEWSELYNCLQPINPAPLLYLLHTSQSRAIESDTWTVPQHCKQPTQGQFCTWLKCTFKNMLYRSPEHNSFWFLRNVNTTNNSENKIFIGQGDD
jgi:hypothetical protein